MLVILSVLDSVCSVLYRRIEKERLRVIVYEGGYLRMELRGVYEIKVTSLSSQTALEALVA